MPASGRSTLDEPNADGVGQKEAEKPLNGSWHGDAILGSGLDLDSSSQKSAIFGGKRLIESALDSLDRSAILQGHSRYGPRGGPPVQTAIPAIGLRVTSDLSFDDLNSRLRPCF
jgi:hypothetical protein